MPESAPRRRPWSRILLFGWWGLMFTGTHIPLPPGPGEPVIPDKLIHYLMFAVLGVLLPCAFYNRDATGWRQYARLFCVMVLYSALDELLQIPVGRTAEWRDWWCDLAGGATGLALYAVIAWQWPRPAAVEL